MTFHQVVDELVIEGVQTLLVYRLDGRTPLPHACEEAGEDAGFYEPRQERSTLEDGPINAVLVTEGFQGQLCDHEWGLRGRYGRNPYGTHARCKKCELFVSTATKKRSYTTTYHYDEWVLRKHIWDRWLERGPVPGSLTAQEHHR